MGRMITCAPARLARLLALLSARAALAEWNASTTGASSRRAQSSAGVSHEVFYPLLEIEANGEYLARSEAVAGASAVADTGADRLGGAQAAPHVGQADARRHLEEKPGRDPASPGGRTADAYASSSRPPFRQRSYAARKNSFLRWNLLGRRLRQSIWSGSSRLIRHAFSVSPPGAAVSVASRAKRRYELTVTAAPEVIAERASVYLPAGHRTTSALGLEIGLEIVRRLVVMHGGSLEVRRKAGKGIRAVVELPRAKKPRPVDA